MLSDSLVQQPLLAMATATWQTIHFQWPNKSLNGACHLSDQWENVMKPTALVPVDTLVNLKS